MADYNNESTIAGIRTEIGLNQKSPHFDNLFKIITIGDPGNYSTANCSRKWKIVLAKTTNRKLIRYRAGHARSRL